LGFLTQKYLDTFACYFYFLLFLLIILYISCETTVQALM